MKYRITNNLKTTIYSFNDPKHSSFGSFQEARVVRAILSWFERFRSTWGKISTMSSYCIRICCYLNIIEYALKSNGTSIVAMVQAIALYASEYGKQQVHFRYTTRLGEIVWSNSTMWHAGEPSGDGSCGYLWNRGISKLNDVYCSQHGDALCESDRAGESHIS